MMQFLKDKALGSLMAALLSCGMATSVTAQEADVTTTQEPAGQAEQAGQAAPDAAPAVVRTVSKASSGLPLALLPLQEGVPLRAADPESVVLWPGGARITAHEELTPETSPDGTEAFFVVPAGARDMEISVEGARLLRWSSTPCFLPAQGGLAHERQEAQENLRALRGEQAMLRAVLDTWTKRPVTQPGQDLEQLASRLENRVPALVSPSCSGHRHYCRPGRGGKKASRAVRQGAEDPAGTSGRRGFRCCALSLHAARLRLAAPLCL